MNLIEFDLVDGGAYDCVPHSLVYVESFDERKNDSFEEAQTFILHQNEITHGYLLSTTPYAQIVEQVAQFGPYDWFEATNQEGNRVFVRKTSVVSRRSTDVGSELSVMVGAETRIVLVKESMTELRELMRFPEPEIEIVE